MKTDLFFRPQSVAIIGASPKPGKVGFEVLTALQRDGYRGTIYAINPYEKTILDRQTYPDLDSLPEKPDLVIIAIPPSLVITMMEQCARIGVKAVIILTTGFTKFDRHMGELEQKIPDIASRSDMAVIGPNCLGIMATKSRLNASFAGKLPRRGTIGYFSESGSIMAATVDMANHMHMGFSKLVNIGKKITVTEVDILKAFGNDPEIQVIAGYLETFADGDSFIRQAEKIGYDKPILLIKSGATPAGARAASSHTGRLTGRDTIYDTVFERAGVIRCESLQTQLALAQTFATQKLPSGPGIAIIASAGGASIMATDAIERTGLELARFSSETRKRLEKELDDVLTINNPIELLGNVMADQYRTALSITLNDPGVDAALVMLTPHVMTESIALAQAVAKTTKSNRRKPVLCCLLGSARITRPMRILTRSGLPVFNNPERAVRALKAMLNRTQWRSRPKRVVKLFPVNRRKVEKVINWHIKQKTFEVSEIETKKILSAYGFITPRGAMATSAEQAVNLASQMGFPVVLKIWSPEVSHKSQIGGVRIDLQDEQAVRDAFDLMMYRIPRDHPEITIPGILVEEMVQGGMEVILGMIRDPRFGALLMVGMGGKLVEMLRDVSFYPAPLTAGEAREMLLNTRTYQLLTGIKGQEGVDIGAIAEGLQRLSQLVTEFPQIKEMDINPFVVGHEGQPAIAVDAKITLTGPPTE